MRANNASCGMKITVQIPDIEVSGILDFQNTLQGGSEFHPEREQQRVAFEVVVSVSILSGEVAGVGSGDASSDGGAGVDVNGGRHAEEVAAAAAAEAHAAEDG